MNEESFDLLTFAVETAGVVYAAACIWLVVRIINRREKWAKWTMGALLIVLGLYVASSGPTIPMAIRWRWAVNTPTRFVSGRVYECDHWDLT